MCAAVVSATTSQFTFDFSMVARETQKAAQQSQSQSERAEESLGNQASYSGVRPPAPSRCLGSLSSTLTDASVTVLLKGPLLFLATEPGGFPFRGSHSRSQNVS